MQWFKHDSDALTDYKLRKLVIKYGTDGYAIYFHCIELITGNLSESNITFELEHDAEVIADDLRVQGTATQSGVERVNEIMRYMVELGLFEDSNDHIFCFKLLKRLDSSMTSNPKMRTLIANARESHDGVMTESCKNRIDKNKIDKNRKEEEKREPPAESPRSKLPSHGKLNNVHLKDSEWKDLRRTYGPWVIDDYVEQLSLYLPNHPGKYKNHYATLLNWLRRGNIPKQSAENVRIMEEGE